jgi:hypothetical protein
MKHSMLFAKIDLCVAACLAALSMLLIHGSNGAAEDAVRRYGYNVDSGAIEWMMGILWAAPLALLFAIASLTLWRGWRIARYVHWLAVAAVAALPFADYFLIF